MVAVYPRIIAALLLLWCCAHGATAEPASQFETRILKLVSSSDPGALAEALVKSDSSLAFVHRAVVEAAQSAAREGYANVRPLLDSLAKSGRLSNPRLFWSSGMIAVTCDEVALRLLLHHPGISELLPNSLLALPPEAEPLVERGPNSLDAISDALNEIRAPLAWQLGLTGVGVLVSHFDTGVNSEHPALAGKYRGNTGHPHSECWFDLVEPITSTPGDNDGHGTLTMGLQVGSAPSDTVGVAWNAEFIAAAISGGGVTVLNALEAFDWVIDPDGNPQTFDDVPRVLSQSWGFSGGMDICSQTLVPAIQTAEAAGIAVVWAAGNDGPYAGTILNPANLADTPTTGFCVGGWNGTTDAVWGSSSRGPTQCTADLTLRIKPEVSSPAYSVRSTYLGTTYASSSGTSFAAPLAAGTLALMVEANPTLPPDSLLELLMFTAVDVDSPGLDNSCGYGLIDVPMACYAALTGLGWVRGTVTDPWGLPIESEIQLIDHPHHTHSDVNGSFLMSLPAYFPFSLRTLAAGYDLDERTVMVFPGDTVVVEIILGPTPHGYLTGTVIDCRDNPAQGAMVELLNTQEPVQLTDGNGRFLFTLDPGFYTVACSSAVCDAALAPNVEVVAGGITDIEVVLPVNPSFICSPSDGFGYKLCDSNDPDGPSFGFTSISPSLGEDGVIHNLSDDGYTALALPFPVTYYGQTYNRAYLSGNGIVSFVKQVQQYNNSQLPADTQSALYPFWDDLSDDQGGQILSDYDRVAGTFTLEWHDVPRHVTVLPPLDSVNAQVVFYDEAMYPTTTGSNLIEFRYGESQVTNSATIGIDREWGTHYVRYGYNGVWESHAVPVQPNLAIRVSDGDPITANPSFALSPAGLALSLGSDTLLDTSIVIHNFGDCALSYEIQASAPALLLDAEAYSDALPGAPEPGKGEIERGESYTISPLDDTAPDANGYSWGDSRNSGGPTYSFTDISSIGTNMGITADDTTSHPHELPWAFPFYGRYFDRISVCTNGFLSFWSQSFSWIDEPLTTQRDPYYMIAPFWMDLNPTTATARVYKYFETANNRFIIQWHRIPRWQGSPSNTYTFQAALYPNGTIELVYQNMMDVVNQATTGLKGRNAAQYIQFSYNSNFLASNMLLRITHPDTNAVSVTVLHDPAGIIAPLDSQVVGLRIFARAGLNQMSALPFTLATSDPLTPSFTLPVVVSSGVPFEPEAVLQPYNGGLRLVWNAHPHGRYRIESAVAADSLFVPLVASTTDTSYVFALPPETQRFYHVILAP
ncbi:S8 family serine peptidase [bacterium]|nr:S8 family serine peptidase [bacterium]